MRQILQQTNAYDRSVNVITEDNYYCFAFRQNNQSYRCHWVVTRDKRQHYAIIFVKQNS